jgi:hypothetical protein
MFGEVIKRGRGLPPDALLEWTVVEILAGLSHNNMQEKLRVEASKTVLQ